MPVTDRERDEIRLAAQNYIQETKEEWEKFKMQGREYLQEDFDFADLEERIMEYGDQRSETDNLQVPEPNPNVNADPRQQGFNQV